MDNKEEQTAPEIKNPEIKLKEMSRKAKEKRAQGGGKPTQKTTKNNWTNLNMLLFRIGGASVLGIVYLIFEESSKKEFKFVPVERNERELRDKSSPFKTSGLPTIPEERETTPPQKLKTAQQFEFNCF